MRGCVLVGLVACTATPVSQSHQAVTTEQRHEHLTLIRDVAASLGLGNAALLGGIAVSETGLAHCWSEATWACQGPASPSCDGGPVIAGAADGPCADMQGGLGMFQFDAGTYTDTVNAYGDAILTIEGNTAQAVAFVVDKVERDIAGTTDWLGAMTWMGAVPLVAGDPTMEQWAQLLACRYNGCCTQSATCTTRANGYRDNAISVYTEMGAAFWDPRARCATQPDDAVIEERSSCYVAGGTPASWHHETTGNGGTLDWTMTTDAATPSMYAEWLIQAPAAGRYSIQVSLDGTFGRSQHATYEIHHAGTVDTVAVDQTSATGFVSLGDFEIAADGTEYVQLGNNTGEAGVQLAFDAIEVTALDSVAPSHGGGCAAGGAVGGGVLVVLVFVLRRRQLARSVA
ncbi:MAG TPA: hypothetical protein VGO00_25520 [Kofleriaceae bacterium]|nr:hypothetical protein [Kofleriaceae bacterium]